MATWDDVFGAACPEVAGIGRRVRALIREVDPEVVEVAYPGYASVSFGVGPRKMRDGHSYVMVQRDRVNLGFYHGAGLPDPAGLLEGTGAALRHVKLWRVEQVEEPALRALIGAAVAERRAAQGDKRGT